MSAHLEMEDFFEVEEGISFDDEVGIVKLIADPTVGVGRPSPVGSLGLRTNGLHYRNIGVGNTAWQQTDLSGGGGGDFPITLSSGGTCNVSVGVLGFTVNLNAGGSCTVAVT